MPAKKIENFRCQYITAHNCQIRRSLSHRWLLNEPVNLIQVVNAASRIDNTVPVGLIRRYSLNTDHRASCPFILLDKLPCARHLRFNNIVAKQNSEWLIANEVACAPYSMSKTLGFLLPYIMEIDIRRFAYFFQNIQLSLFLKRMLQLKGDIEVILDRSFSFACHDDDILNAGFDCFLHNVLNRWLVNDWKHLFRHRFCCRQETGSKSGCRDNGFCHFFHLISPYPFFMI
ncbi:hypothetical protein D3C78_1114080 [compost metagenome]